MEKQWEQWQILFSWAPKSLQMVTAAMKLKDACSLEEKLWQSWKWKSGSEVALSCLTLCNPLDCSPPGFSVHGIFQARILEWGAISFSRRSSRLRDWTWVSCIGGRRFTVWTTLEVQINVVYSNTKHQIYFSQIKLILWLPMTCMTYFCFTDYAKAFDCVDHNKLGKFFKRWEYQTTLPASWKICMQVKKQQLELAWNNGLVPNRKRSTSRLYIVTLLI